MNRSSRVRMMVILMDFKSAAQGNKAYKLNNLTFRHRAFRYSPENAFCIFNQQIYFIIWYLLDRAS